VSGETFGAKAPSRTQNLAVQKLKRGLIRTFNGAPLAFGSASIFRLKLGDPGVEN
jgi:hypothetical protein